MRNRRKEKVKKKRHVREREKMDKVGKRGG